MAACKNAVPVPLPPDVGALGFDTTFWAGFAIVSLWAALDAFAERVGLAAVQCSVCKSRGCVAAKFTHIVDSNNLASLRELEDLRHLYAHNYAGEADELYFRDLKRGTQRHRHALTQGKPTDLTSGAKFDGRKVWLELRDARFYARVVAQVLDEFPLDDSASMPTL